MIQTNGHKAAAAPMWVAIAAPLVGVPLMVALLALTAPVPQQSGAETAVTVPAEQVEVSVESVLDLSATDCPLEIKRS